MDIELRTANQSRTEGEVAVLPSQRTNRKGKRKHFHSFKVEKQNKKDITLQQRFVHQAVEQQHTGKSSHRIGGRTKWPHVFLM